MTPTTPPGPMALREPLHLTPVLVPKPWGGRRLEGFGHVLPAGVDIGESWEVADLDPTGDGSEGELVTRVRGGPWEGASLREVIAGDRVGLLGSARDLQGGFPLLVKLLDAREPLSIQVHPPDAYVVDHPGVARKTESWVVLDAAEGADLFLGVRAGVTFDQLRDAVGTSRLVPLLGRVPARPGDVHHLPAGRIHALGGGIVVAEFQTPSDTTFRLYDWVDELGRPPRELHLDAGLESVRLTWGASDATWTPSVADPELLVATEDYVLRRLVLAGGGARPLSGGVPRVLLVTHGTLEGDGFLWPLERGGVVLLPAGWSGALRSGTGATVLSAEIPVAEPVS